MKNSRPLKINKVELRRSKRRRVGDKETEKEVVAQIQTPNNFETAITDLPQEIIGLILNYLPVSDLCALNKTSAFFHAEVEHELLKKLQVKQIECGGLFTLFLCEGGSLYACGDNDYGQTGLGVNVNDSAIPTPVTRLPLVKIVCAGGSFTLVVGEDGSLYSFGLNNAGQLGFQHRRWQSDIKQIPYAFSSPIKSIAAGGWHVLIQCENGELFVFGDNSKGQLGRGSITIQRTPLKILIPNRVKAIAAGSSNSFFICDDGSVYGCGSNLNGELGFGPELNRYYPSLIPNLISVKAIAVGGAHTLFLKEDGSVFACGNSKYGQTGHGNEEWMVPVQIQNLPPIAAIAAGDKHSIFLAKDGTVYVCGLNEDGQLGLGDINPRSRPTKIPGLPPIAAISAGAYHTILQDINGFIYALGQGSFGQLGIGDYKRLHWRLLPTTKPTPIKFFNHAKPYQPQIGQHITLENMEERLTRIEVDINARANREELQTVVANEFAQIVQGREDSSALLGKASKHSIFKMRRGCLNQIGLASPPKQIILDAKRREDRKNKLSRHH